VTALILRPREPQGGATVSSVMRTVALATLPAGSTETTRTCCRLDEVDLGHERAVVGEGRGMPANQALAFRSVVKCSVTGVALTHRVAGVQLMVGTTVSTTMPWTLTTVVRPARS